MEKTHATLDEAAGSFADDLVSNHEAWLKGQDQVAAKADWSDPVDSRLYSVQTWLPFGHLDTLGLLAVDDIDAAHVVIGRYKYTIEEVTTAFCPIMEPYRAPSEAVRSRYRIMNDDRSEGRHIFADYLDLMENRETGLENRLRIGAKQQTRPLAILSRLRLFPLLTMGRALSSLDAMYRLVAETMVDAYRDLKRHVGEDIHPGTPLYTLEDLDSIKLSFLDLQDEEEIGIFVTGTSYTVMMALIAAVQRLTVNQFIECEPTAAKALFDCRSIRDVLKLEKSGGEAVGEVAAKIGDCHLFRWSRSLAAISPHLANPDYTNLKFPTAEPTGMLGIETLVGIMPGHQTDAEQILKDIASARCQLSSGSRDSDPSFRMHMLGINDLLLRWENSESQSVPDEFKGLLGVKAAIALWPDLLLNIGRSGAIERRRDFTAWESLISIPVPNRPPYHLNIGPDHRRILHDVMVKLETDQRLACLQEQEIRRSTGEAGFPATSKRPLILLSQSFGQVLTNPLIFDVVLDYIDLVETLAYAVTKGTQTSDHPDDFTPRPPLALVEQLDELLGAIDDAFELRLRRIYPEDSVRDWSLDLRSQNHQVFLAADAVLKCAIAVFRKDVLGVGREKQETPADGSSRRVLGILLRLGFHSGMHARDLKAFRLPFRDAPYQQVPRLAIFEADFPHLRSILVYADFFHEAFHLIFEELAIVKGETEISLPDGLSQKIRQALPEGNPGSGPDVAVPCKEMFVHMMMMLFVFDGNRALLLRDHLEGLSNSVAMADSAYKMERPSTNVLREDRAKRFARHTFDAVAPLIWLEAALALEGEQPAAVDLCRRNSDLEARPFPTICEFTQKIWSTVTENKSAASDFDWIFSDPEAKRFFEAEIGSLYAHTFSYLPGMWCAARAIFAQHVSRLACESFGGDEDLEEELKKTPLERNRKLHHADPDDILNGRLADKYMELQAEIDENIMDGWASGEPGDRFSPLPKILVHDTPSHLMPEGEAFDGNLIVRRSLYHYLKLYRTSSGAGIRSLPRGLDGKIDKKTLESKAHAPFLIDRTAVNHFCCVPAERRRRTGRDVAVLKAMWGIAARNRARRLSWLMRHAADPPEGSEPELESSVVA